MSSYNRVYIGRLPYHSKEKDVERFFRGFGRIKDINLKNGFGFVVSDKDVTYIYIYIICSLLHYYYYQYRNLMTTEMQKML